MVRKVDARGGNGDVIFDLDKGTAKKYLRNTSSVDKIQRFLKEINVLKEIGISNIPNIVEVKEVHIDDKISNSYIEMKKYDGSLYDMFDITKGNVIYSLKLILPIIKALECLAKKKPAIYHRDIKPDNILFLKNEEMYSLHLTDFGICFLKDGSERITPEIMAIGPRMFIAPEYEVGRVEEIDEKGDIFSIGKVIWCMINGEKNEFLPSNFWFVDEYNLQQRFPNHPDMVVANMIIAACLGINPNERCEYSFLISQIEAVLETNKISFNEQSKNKVKVYQEKRKMELVEIKEKNKLLVNCFSQYYVSALKKLVKEYDGFELIQILYEEYQRKSKDGINYTTVNVDNNSTHYLYSRTYDRVYIAINYNSARENDKYCNITIRYNISSTNLSKTIRIYFENNYVILCEYNGKKEVLSITSMIEILNMFVMDYIS